MLFWMTNSGSEVPMMDSSSKNIYCRLPIVMSPVVPQSAGVFLRLNETLTVRLHREQRLNNIRTLYLMKLNIFSYILLHVSRIT
jgi:hypothetical protein